jgi:kumamolisin
VGEEQKSSEWRRFKSMKRSIELIVVAAVVLLGFATSAPAQVHKGASVRPPQAPGVGVSVAPPTISSGVGSVFTPYSSIAKPGSAGVSAHTNVEVFVPQGFKPASVLPPFSGYGYNTPASIGCRYYVSTHIAGCNPNNGSLTNPTGGSQTIAIVDAYDDPWIAVDLAYFSAAFGLPFSTAQIQVVYASGFEPPEDHTGGWELEESLDVEYAHAMAPNANIVLVEAASNSYADLLTAVHVASCEVAYGNATCTGSPTGSGEVSMSWGSGEWSGETAYDTYFGNTAPGAPGVVYFAASGDSPGVSYPCSSPKVVCVGGTTYSRFPVTLGGEQEGIWELTGGGSSAYEGTPSPNYQNAISGTLSSLVSGGFFTSATNRAVPDIAANANPNTGYWVFDSFDFALQGYGNAPGGWWIVGGTSASTPIIAGITNLAGTAHGFQTSSAAELSLIYSGLGSGNFQDVLPNYGLCGPYQGYVAAAGWDPCSGVGVPQGLGGL